MGAEEILHSPSRTQGAAGSVTSAIDALQSRFDGFQRGIAEYGDAFGEDDLGFLIGGLYQAINELAFGSYTDNADEMKTYAQKLHTMAVNQDMGEQANVVEVNNVRKMLG